MFHGDNLNGDGSVWLKHFLELKDGVIPVASLVDPTLPLATIADDECTLMTTKQAANVWAMAAMNNIKPLIDKEQKISTGVDCEWMIGEVETRLLQVSTRSGSFI